MNWRIEMKAIIVNHGNVFNHGKDFFTFYCSNCRKQLTAGNEKCEHCNESAEYNVLAADEKPAIAIPLKSSINRS